MWHYYVGTTSEELAKETGQNKFIEEHSNDLLLETGGLFMVTAVEEKDPDLINELYK